MLYAFMHFLAVLALDFVSFSWMFHYVSVILL